MTAAGAAGLVLLGRFLGAFELFLLGAGVAALLAVAVASTRLTRLQLGVSRTLVPPRVHAGSPARVELRVTNQAGRRSPVLRLHEAVTGTRGATLMLSPLNAAESARAAYQLPTDRRGVLHIGPLQVIVGDPFGLSQSRTVALEGADLVIYPRLDDVVPAARAAGHDPQATARHPNAADRAGDDFYALRPYVIGDDLRRVHWPSTARAGELLVRQHELPWQERTTVLLDVRTFAHSAASFELAVSAAASVLHACSRRGDQVRLYTTDRFDSGFGTGRAHLDAGLHRLATVTLDQGASIQASIEELTRSPGGGTLVMVAAALSSSDLSRFGALSRRYGHVVTVVFEPSSHDPRGVDQPPPRVASHVLQINRSQPFADTWNRTGGGAVAATTSSEPALR